jgi:FkbM family methyltransferase
VSPPPDFTPRSLRSIARSVLLAATPPRSRLATELAIERIRGRLPEELRHLGALTSRRGTAIDIGANRGHYSLVMSRLFERVVAFEPNPDLTLDLERCGAANLTIHHCALSSSSGERDLYVPRVRGRELVGWGSFEKQDLPGCESFRVIQVPFRRLDDYEFSDVSLIKINAPMHEAEVLEGARRTMATHRPAVIAQIERENRDLFEKFLGGLGLGPHVAEGGSLRPLAEGLVGYRGEKIVFVFKPRGTPRG